MSRKMLQLTARDARKQLLLVESELNRVHWLNEVQLFAGEIRHFKKQAGKISSVVASAATLVATFAAMRQALSHDNTSKDKRLPRFATLIKGVEAGTSLWLLLRDCWQKAKI